MKVAIIAFNHPESSLCLAINLAKNKCEVDYYFITDIIRSENKDAGFEFLRASRKPGIVELTVVEIPEIIAYSNGLSIKFHLLRILSFSPKLFFVNKYIFKYSIGKIKKRNYDAINVIGQHKWVKNIHNFLKDEKIIHTLHEVGHHNDKSTKLDPLLKTLIYSQTKVILPSISSFNRYVSLNGYAENCAVSIPVGKHETIKLYEKESDLNLQIKEEHIFLFYGFIQTYKGLDLLAKSVDILLKLTSNFHIIIAGYGNDPVLSYFEKLPNATVINRYLNNYELVYLNKLCTCVVCP